MNKIKEMWQGQVGQTHQYPSYFYAGFWMRMWAFLTDLIVIQSLTYILLSYVANLEALSKSYVIGSVIIYLLYFIVMTKWTNGQTLGKMIFGLKVICFNEETLSWQTVLIREGACRFIMKSGFWLLGYLLAIFTKRKQHVGDWLTDTSVVMVNVLRATECRQ